MFTINQLVANWFSKMAAIRLLTPHALLKCDIDGPPRKSISVKRVEKKNLSLSLGRSKTGKWKAFKARWYGFCRALLRMLAPGLHDTSRKPRSHREGICRFRPTVPSRCLSGDSQAHEWEYLCHDSSHSHHPIANTKPEKILPTPCPSKHCNREC